MSFPKSRGFVCFVVNTYTSVRTEPAVSRVLLLGSRLARANGGKPGVCSALSQGLQRGAGRASERHILIPLLSFTSLVLSRDCQNEHRPPLFCLQYLLCLVLLGGDKMPPWW